MKNTDVRLYNVLFPVWLLWFFPVTWIVVLPANFVIDLTSGQRFRTDLRRAAAPGSALASLRSGFCATAISPLRSWWRSSDHIGCEKGGPACGQKKRMLKESDPTGSDPLVPVQALYRDLRPRAMPGSKGIPIHLL